MSSNIRKLRITVDGKAYDVAVEMLGESEAQPAAAYAAPAPTYAPPAAPVAPPPAAAAPAPAPAPKAAAGAGSVPCPLSGTVVQVHVTEGQAVKAGELLVTLEAMKMNTPIFAPTAGTVRQISARQGALVEEGTALLVIE